MWAQRIILPRVCLLFCASLACVSIGQTRTDNEQRAEALAKQLYEQYRARPGADGEGRRQVNSAKLASAASSGTTTQSLRSAQAIVPESEPTFLGWPSLLGLSALGLLCGLGVAFTLFERASETELRVLIPGKGEHFSVRPSEQPGEYLLDVMDVRGNLLRTAGTLRPHTVARAAVLPPELAVSLGAATVFDRFELTPTGTFQRTTKEEGYQVFPFVLNRQKAG